jgi:hypothetical protein
MNSSSQAVTMYAMDIVWRQEAGKEKQRVVAGACAYKLCEVWSYVTAFSLLFTRFRLPFSVLGRSIIGIMRRARRFCTILKKKEVFRIISQTVPSKARLLVATRRFFSFF